MVIVYTTEEVMDVNVGERIRTIRKFRKLTQIEVAQKAQIAVNSLRLYESGKRTPNLDQLQTIAKAMGSSLADFLDERDKKIFSKGLDEGEDVNIWVNKTLYGYSFSNTETWLIGAFSKLNAEGQQKAVERVEELTEIPRYQATPAPQSSPAPPEDTEYHPE